MRQNVSIGQIAYYKCNNIKKSYWGNGLPLIFFFEYIYIIMTILNSRVYRIRQNVSSGRIAYIFLSSYMSSYYLPMSAYCLPHTTDFTTDPFWGFFFGARTLSVRAPKKKLFAFAIALFFSWQAVYCADEGVRLAPIN